MIKNRKLTLEQRITRLENALKTSRVKNEETKVNTYDGPGLIVDQGKLRDMVRVWGDGLQNAGLSDAIRSGAGNDYTYIVRLNNGEYWAMDDEDIIEIFDECTNKASRRNIRCKFEQSYEEDVFTADEARRFRRALNMRSGISVIKCVADPNSDSWYVLIADSDGDNETSFGIYKYADGHIEAWRDDRSRYSTSYNSIEECAEDIEPYDTSLWGDEYY